MRYYLVKMYANDDEPARIEDNVYYDKIGKKAVVKAFDRRNWYHSTYRKIIKGVEYTPYIFHVFYKGHNVKKQQVIDVVNKIATIENIDNVICIDVEETSISDTLNENYNFAFPPQVLNFGNLWELGKFVRTKTLFYDWNVNDKFGKSKLKKLAKNTPNSASLSNEIEKIFSMDNSGCVKDGIPVHYIIKGSYKTNSLETLDILANALKQNNRTYSSHIIKFNLDNSCDGRIGPTHFDSCQDYIDSINENLAQALAGNLVVLQYGLDERHGDYAIESYMAVSKFIEILKPVSYCTPIIFSIPENSGDLDVRLQKMLDAPCVCLDVDKKFDASCKTFKQNFKYLENKAKDAGLVADRNLANLLREKMDDASFSDADKLFEEWYSENLIDKKFPAYADTLNVIKDLRTNHDTDAMTQLEELIGLKQVKQQIKDFLARFKMNQELKKLGLPTDEFSMHMAFLGNPGTGKTEVAKLFGQIFKETGFLKENRVVMVNGSTNFNIRKTFQKAKGSVLFIDEAYALGRASYDKENCWHAELIAEMENNRDDTVVILAGYKKAMNKLLDSNVGFRSRLGFILEFPDYTQDELLDIFKLFAKRANKILTKDVIQDARDILWRGGRKTSQGNARFVRKFFEDCCGNQLTRIAKEHEKSNKPYTEKELRTILPCDLDRSCIDGKTGVELLNELIGLKSVKTIVSDKISQLVIQKARRDAGLKSDFIPMHMAFSGNPGTGKTEVARLVGKILNEKGVLSNGDFYECHPGEIAHPDIIDKLFCKAKGSVIFIDEAYAISEWPQNLIASLIKNMEDYREETVVIFAGYSNQIKAMLRKNPGFESRIKNIVEFTDYTNEELIKILKHMIKKNNFKIENKALIVVKELIDKNRNKRNFANGRLIRNIFEQAQMKQASRLLKGKLEKSLSKEEIKLLKPEDFKVEIASADKEVAKIGFKAKRA